MGNKRYSNSYSGHNEIRIKRVVGGGGGCLASPVRIDRGNKNKEILHKIDLLDSPSRSRRETEEKFRVNTRTEMRRSHAIYRRYELRGKGQSAPTYGHLTSFRQIKIECKANVILTRPGLGKRKTPCYFLRSTNVLYKQMRRI